MHTTCEFIFDNNPKRIFYSGQEMNGKLRFCCLTQAQDRCVQINIMGEGHVEWYNGEIKARENYASDSRIVYLEGYNGNIINQLFLSKQNLKKNRK